MKLGAKICKCYKNAVDIFNTYNVSSNLEYKSHKNTSAIVMFIHNNITSVCRLYI